jgi:hypothetical protein
MRKFLLTSLILLSGLGISYAQEQSGSGPNLTDEIKDLCDLTPDQVAQVQPIVADFEAKRDASYKKYRHDKVELAKEVKKNRWDYEVALIGILNPEQMGLLKAFDQRNKELMTGNGTSVTSVAYLRGGSTTPDAVQPATQTAIAEQPSTQVASTDKPIEQTIAGSVIATAPISTSTESSTPVTAASTESVSPAPIPVASVTPESTSPVVTASTESASPASIPVASASTESVLASAVINFCNLTPDQVSKVQPIITAFEAKRDSIYRRHHHDKDVFGKLVRRNRLNYEVAMIDVLNPDQMRMLRAFNLSNRQLMSGSGKNVNNVDFVPPAPKTMVAANPVVQPATTDVTPEQTTTTQPAVADNTPAEQVSSAPIIAESTATPIAIQPTTEDKPAEQTGSESAVADAAKQPIVSVSILTNEIKELCDLTPDQVTQVQPIVADFETKRDETFKKYHHDQVELNKEAKKNRWDYEVSLIGILNPEQMGLLKAFDQRNKELMVGNGKHVVKVDYLVSR